MLFLLRQLRRLELRKRSGQYFLYAIGEIVLIVVGILIALQINTWNEGRKLEQERVKLVAYLKSDFEANQQRLGEMVPRYEKRLQEMETFLRSAAGEGELLPVVEMKQLFTNFHRSIRFVPVLGAYKTSLSTGSIALLDDPTVNELLIEFEGSHERLEAM